jgi:hypothetical protein
MRVVFTGTSGNDKRHVINRIASYFREKHGHSVSTVEAEAALYSLPDDKVYEFLDKLPSNEAVRLWSASLKSALGAWKKENEARGCEPDFSFLSLHATYHVRSHLYCPLNWSYPDQPGSIARGELLEALREFNPDLFINLFDNVYSLQARIRDYPFRLIELLRWRNVEALATDILATLVIEHRNRVREQPEHASTFKYERSPIIAIRHPLEMIHQLIANEQAHRIYMAYPISEPRRHQRATGDDRLMRQVDRFRSYIRQQFVAFDPVTIDERPLKFLWERYVEPKRNLKLKNFKKADLLKEFKAMVSGDVTLELAEQDLWLATPDEYEEMLCGPLEHYRRAIRARGDSEAGSPIFFKLPAGEVRRVVEEKSFWAGTQKGGEIDNQIVRRDYRLIDQADCIVIYRPTMNRPQEWQLGGTRLEYQHAKDTGKPALVIWDTADGPLEDAPFNTTVNPMDILAWSNLDNDETEQDKCFREAASKIRFKISGSVPGL